MDGLLFSALFEHGKRVLFYEQLVSIHEINRSYPSLFTIVQQRADNPHGLFNLVCAPKRFRMGWLEAPSCLLHQASLR